MRGGSPWETVDDSDHRQNADRVVRREYSIITLLETISDVPPLAYHIRLLRSVGTVLLLLLQYHHHEYIRTLGALTGNDECSFPLFRASARRFVSCRRLVLVHLLLMRASGYSTSLGAPSFAILYVYGLPETGYCTYKTI